MDLGPLSAALLFALSVPLVMQYRILPVVGTPYWLFGVLFLLLITKVLISLYPQLLGKYASRASSYLLWSIIIIVLVGVSVTAMVDRHNVAPVWGTHDIILQQEAAMRYFVTGKNPYKETYFGTPVQDFHYDELGKPAPNPALYHFVMPPWYLLFPLPFYYVANHTVGFFDGRMPLLFSMTGILIILRKWFQNKSLGEIAIIITALSPATVNYFIEGRSDIFAFFWLIFALFLLTKRKFFWSGVLMGLALLSKQTTWFAFPFYGVMLWKELKNTKKTMMYMFITFSTSIIITLPFLLWDAKSFIESVVLYLSAGGPTGYPVSGYGFSMILYSLGIIKDLHQYYPFMLWQLGVSIPILIIALKWLLQKPLWSRWFIGYGVFLFAIWYFSRYFNNSHIAIISSIFALGALMHLDESIKHGR